MIRWTLNHVSTPVILIVSVTVALAVGYVAELLADRAFADRSDDARKELNDMLKASIGFIGITLAIITGLVLGNQRDVEVAATANVSNEAAAIRVSDNVLAELPAPVRAPVATALTAYTRAVTGSGFAELRNGRRSAATARTYQDLGRAILALKESGDTNTAMLKGTLYNEWTAIGGLRNDRFELANRELSPELWILLITTGLLTVVVVAGFTAEGRADRFATFGAALTVGLIVFAAIALSYPFSGSISVSPAPIARSVLTTY